MVNLVANLGIGAVLLLSAVRSIAVERTDSPWCNAHDEQAVNRIPGISDASSDAVSLLAIYTQVAKHRFTSQGNQVAEGDVPVCQTPMCIEAPKSQTFIHGEFRNVGVKSVQQKVWSNAFQPQTDLQQDVQECNEEYIPNPIDVLVSDGVPSASNMNWTMGLDPDAPQCPGDSKARYDSKYWYLTRVGPAFGLDLSADLKVVNPQLYLRKWFTVQCRRLRKKARWLWSGKSKADTSCKCSTVHADRFWAYGNPSYCMQNNTGYTNSGAFAHRVAGPTRDILAP